MTLQEFFTRNLEYSKISYTTNSTSAITYSFNHLIEYLGPFKNVNEITIDECEMFLLSTFSRTKYGAALFFRTLKASFNRGKRWRVVDNNPFLEIRLPKIAKRHPAFITRAQLDLICNATTNPHLHNIYTALFYTGMRVGELLALKWSSVDIDKRVIVVKNDEDFTTKSKLDRIIPISTNLLVAFKSLQKENNNSNVYVFKQYSKYYVSHSFKSVCKVVGISKDIHLHSLRHSFASNLVNKGASLYVVKELMGHADYKTTQIYAHLNREALEDAVSLLN